MSNKTPKKKDKNWWKNNERNGSFQGSLTSCPDPDPHPSPASMSERCCVASHEPSNYAYYITSCLQFNVKNLVFYPKKQREVKGCCPWNQEPGTWTCPESCFFVDHTQGSKCVWIWGCWIDYGCCSSAVLLRCEGNNNWVKAPIPDSQLSHCDLFGWKKGRIRGKIHSSYPRWSFEPRQQLVKWLMSWTKSDWTREMPIYV